MRMTLMVTVCMVLVSSICVAELQNVQVGGSIRIRGNMFSMDQSVTFADTSFVEQRTRLNVTAEFTDNVSAFIELDSYDVWGEDFRSNYVTGLDGRAASVDDVEVYQAYIEAKEMWGTPLKLKVGRQEMEFGSDWLVGVNNASSYYQGLSFDALRLDYATDLFSITAFASKLVETFQDFGDDDTDFYGVYASYLGIEDISLDAYWMFVRDDVPAQAGSGIPGMATATNSNLHTVGLRGSGTIGAVDFQADAAYQFGEVEMDPVWGVFLLHDMDADYDSFGANVEAGYTFDASYAPRVYLGFAYLEGAHGDALPFNRLFSNWEYSEFIENSDLSNVYVYRAGVSANPLEALSLSLALTYFVADQTDSGGWWLWSWSQDENIGFEAGLYAAYQYSEDLAFRAGWAHFFADDGVADGVNITFNGLAPWLGDDDDDYDYVFLESELKF